VLINLAKTGIMPMGELMDLTRADVGAASSASRRGYRLMWRVTPISKY
jgi:hypothetical protein